jgi:hypothetical protein
MRGHGKEIGEARWRRWKGRDFSGEGKENADSYGTLWRQDPIGRRQISLEMLTFVDRCTLVAVYLYRVILSCQVFTLFGVPFEPHSLYNSMQRWYRVYFSPWQKYTAPVMQYTAGPRLYLVNAVRLVTGFEFSI